MIWNPSLHSCLRRPPKTEFMRPLSHFFASPGKLSSTSRLDRRLNCSLSRPRTARTLQSCRRDTAFILASSHSERKFYDGPPSPRLSDVPEGQLRQLIDSNVSQKSGLKLGIKSVSDKVALDIFKRWNTKDVIKIDAAHKKARGNMKETRAALEQKTGGIVIWNQGSQILLYKGPEAVEKMMTMTSLSHKTIDFDPRIDDWDDD